MHLGLIIDDERLRNEHAMLARLVLHLLENGEQVTRLIPAHMDLAEIEPIEEPVAHVNRVVVPMRVPLFMRGARARAAAAALSRSIPDVFLAVGKGAWTTARELAARLNRPATIDVWCSDQVPAVTRGRAGQRVSAFLAATPPLAEALGHRVEPELVSVVPFSAELPAAPRTILETPDRCITAAIVGGGRDMPCCAALLAALSALAREVPQLQLAIELAGPHEHAIWREAKRLGLLGRLSAVSRADAVVPLVTACDLLLMPRRHGEMTSLILEAMAAGMAIVAAADPYLDMLVDDETASLTSGVDTDQWVRQIRRLIQHPEHARRLGDGARRLVRSAYHTEHQAAALVEVLSAILSGGALPITAR